MSKWIIILFFSIIAFCSIAWAGQSFFADDWTSKETPVFSSYEDSVAFTGPATATVTISANDTVAKVLPSYFGNNINPWIGREIIVDSFARAHLENAGISYLRLPGGNWSNKMLWDGENHWTLLHDFLDSIKGVPNQTWTITPSEMVTLAGDIGAKPQICVNLSLARFIKGPDSVEQAAHYAADWVRSVNANSKTYTRYWEVGNENYGSWQSGWIVDGDTLDGAYYGRAFCVFADSMKAADPTIKIGAVVVEKDDGYASGGHFYWMKKMLPLIVDKADFLAYHEYFTWAEDLNTITVKESFESLVKVKNAKDSIGAIVNRYTELANDSLPIAVTEYNIRAGRKSNEAMSGLFIAMAVPEFIRNGYGLVNLWDVADGYDETEGDFGMLSMNDPNETEYTPHPNFYPYFLFRKMMGDVLVNSSALDYTSLYSAATRFCDGALSVLLVNPTENEQTVKLNLENFSATDSVYGFTVSANSATADNIYLNGRTGAFGPLDYTEIPPWKRPIGDTLFTLTPWSYQFILLKTTASIDAIPMQKLNSLSHPISKNRDARGKNIRGENVRKARY